MAEKESLETTIVEERVEFMVDHTSSNVIQNPTERIAHFLKPSLNPNALPPQFPKIQSFSSLSKPNVLFSCSSTPIKGWETWVEKLRVTHEPTWRKAGIFDAIKGSTYHIGKVKDLIFSLVERWCPETNTFVFPWGEATVTLEDVYVLGGFSPLGDSVLSKSSLGENVEFVVNELLKIYTKLVKLDHNLSHLRWQEHFIRGSSRCSNQIENAGFLVFWLTRHVFPGKAATVVTRAGFSMAARLSCGAKLAFAPVILASIYNDLTLLKRKIAGSCGRPLMLTSPLHLVQVWAWERFPLLGPVPRIIYCGETRLGRWENNERKLYDDIQVCLDSSRETFCWRPYAMSLANWSLPRFYVDSGMYVDVDSHEEWKLFCRCLMTGQLIGLKNCVQGYNPHRVALQFGYDQDIPESIDRSKASCKLAGWLGYKKSLSGLKLYIPPRLHEGDVTHRYCNWWRARSNLEEEVRVGCKRKKRTMKRVKKMSKICDGSSKFEAMYVAGNARENPLEKPLPREDSSSRNVLQVCNHTRMSRVLQMKVGSISQEDACMGEDEVRNINHRMGECSSFSDHCSSYNEEGGNEIDTLCSEPVRSDFVAIHQNLATEVGKFRAMSQLMRPKGGSKPCLVNATEHNNEHNVVDHNVKMEAKTLDNQLAEDEPAVTSCEDKDPMNQAILPAGSLAVSNDHYPLLAPCVQYEFCISRIEKVISALLGTNLA